MKFGEKVKKARQERKMTQKELAERAGISLRTVLNYEGGERLPKSRKVYASIADSMHQRNMGAVAQNRRKNWSGGS